MIHPQPITLEENGVRLEPLQRSHAEALRDAAAHARQYRVQAVAPHACLRTLGCSVVGFRVDDLNVKSQIAVAALGAKKDGVIRRFEVRSDGSARDTHFYSIVAEEWPEVRQRLEERLRRGAR